jgi:hypothetical protein
MRSFWSDPYLWIHLAGLAAVPILLELCLLGLAVGDPILPVWLEIMLVAAVGIGPVLWMQWQRPFYIFSIVAVALQPTQLTEAQRRLLTLFKSPRNRVGAIGVALLLLLVLQRLYAGAAIAVAVAPLPPSAHGLGLLWAAIAFLATNLFLQVPVSVLGVMLNSEATVAATPPQTLEAITSGFTILGLKLRQILPALVATPPAAPAIATTNPATGHDRGLEEDPWTRTAEPLSMAEAIPNLQPDDTAAQSSAPAPLAPDFPIQDS